MATLELQDLRKSFGTTPVLHNIDLHIEHGELVVLVINVFSKTASH